MKAVVLGTLTSVGLALAAIGVPDHCGEVFAQQLPPSPAVKTGSQLIVVPAPAAGNAQLLTVIDPKLCVMSVYRIDLTTGKIALCSVRNIRWDLQLMYLNNEDPLPHEIRALLEQR